MINATSTLFLGVELTPTLKALLADAPAALNQQYSGHLQIISYKKSEYIGKSIGMLSDFSELELAEAHILSILKRLIPSFDPQKHPSGLITVENT